MAKSIPKVSGMDWIVEQLSQQEIEPDEFTAEMISNKTKATRSSVHHRLKRMRESGELTSRKISLNGTTVSVYKRATPSA
jgi:GTP-sensing pleiotropic transcriptional regulator CodY